MLGSDVPLEVVGSPENPMAQMALNVRFLMGLNMSDKLILVLVPKIESKCVKLNQTKSNCVKLNPIESN